MIEKLKWEELCKRSPPIIMKFLTDKVNELVEKANEEANATKGQGSVRASTKRKDVTEGKKGTK